MMAPTPFDRPIATPDPGPVGELSCTTNDFVGSGPASAGTGTVIEL